MDTDNGRGHDHDLDLFVTAEEAARVAGVSARTVRRWIIAGDVQATEGERGRVVSLSDVRRHTDNGHVRTRPPSASPRRRMTVDTDTSAAMSVMSESVNAVAAFAERLESLAREAERAKIRAEIAEARIETLQNEIDRLRAPETRTMPHIDSPEAPGREQAVVMAPDTLHAPSLVASAWRRLKRAGSLA